MSVRSLVFLSCGLMLAASASNAANYSFSGKFTSNRGKIINIPLVGNTPCAPLTLMTGPGNGGTMTPATHMIIRGANTQPQMAVTTNFKGTGRDLLCVKNQPNLFVKTSGGTAMGKGGAFVMPGGTKGGMGGAFSKPFVGKLRAVEVKYAPPVLQLATSFKVTGPRLTPTTGLGGTMKNGMNTAAFRHFRKGAFTTQTGRAGLNFTWCPHNTFLMGTGAPCTNINAAAFPKELVKYKGASGNNFGGTMSYVLTTGANTSSLALSQGAMGSLVATQILAGMGSQPTARGYADFLTDKLAPGPVHFGFTRMIVSTSVVGKQNLITMVGPSVGMLPSGTNFNWGFPLTTRTVLARNYGKTFAGGTRTTTLTAMGHDTITAMGKRDISLVAGGLAVANLGGTIKAPTPEILTMQLLLPEPDATLQVMAGVAALVGIAAWRSRRAR